MNVVLNIVTVIFLVFVWHSETTKECYQAKICFHDAIEKCGIDEKGTLRRFLDSCDIMEYNCYYNGTYAKTDPASCVNLPPIPTDNKTDVRN